jgi:DNA-binding Xre family transcriptional regulator
MIYKKKRGTLKPNSSSIVLHLQPILMARNITKPYTYLTGIGISNNSVNKMLKGEAVQINFKQLTTLCTHLNCTPNDLFALRDLTPLPGHQLEKLPNTTDEVINPIDQFKNLGLEDFKNNKINL